MSILLDSSFLDIAVGERFVKVGGRLVELKVGQAESLFVGAEMEPAGRAGVVFEPNVQVRVAAQEEAAQETETVEQVEEGLPWR